MKWEDTTSYSRGDDKRIPRTWKARIKSFTLVVTRHIHHAPDIWIFNCEPFCREYELTAKDIDAAKVEAEYKFRKAIDEVVAILK